MNNNMSIDEIIELMEELLDNSSAVPFSSKKMIDCEQMRDYIDNLHLSLPPELEKAKETQRQRENIIAEGNAEAEKVIKRAENEADKIVRKAEEGLEAAKNKAYELVSETEITKNAEARAAEIIKAAHNEAEVILDDAKAEADQIITDARENDKRIRRALADSVNKALSDAREVLETAQANISQSTDQVVSTMNAVENLNRRIGGDVDYDDRRDDDDYDDDEDDRSDDPGRRRKFKFR